MAELLRYVTLDVGGQDRKSTRLNSSHGYISYAVLCLKKKNTQFPPPSHLPIPPVLLPPPHRLHPTYPPPPTPRPAFALPESLPPASCLSSPASARLA